MIPTHRCRSRGDQPSRSHGPRLYIDLIVFWPVASADGGGCRHESHRVTGVSVSAGEIKLLFPVSTEVPDPTYGVKRTPLPAVCASVDLTPRLAVYRHP